jgi:hypothetical protein
MSSSRKDMSRRRCAYSQCGRLLDPSLRIDALYCDKTCAAKARRERERGERVTRLEPEQKESLLRQIMSQFVSPPERPQEPVQAQVRVDEVGSTPDEAKEPSGRAHRLSEEERRRDAEAGRRARDEALEVVTDGDEKEEVERSQTVTKKDDRKVIRPRTEAEWRAHVGADPPSPVGPSGVDYMHGLGDRPYGR